MDETGCTDWKGFHVRQHPTKTQYPNFLGFWFGVSGGLFLVGSLSSWPLAIVAGLFAGILFFAHFIWSSKVANISSWLLLMQKRPRKSIEWSVLWLPFFFTEYVLHWEKGHITHHCTPVKSRIHKTQIHCMASSQNVFELWCALFIKTNLPKYPKKARFEWFFCVGFIPVSDIFIKNSCDVCVVLEYGQYLNLLKSQEHGGEPPMKNYLFFVRTYFYFYPLQFCSPFFIILNITRISMCQIYLSKYHNAILPIVPKELRPYYFHREYVRQMKGQKPVPNRELSYQNKDRYSPFFLLMLFWMYEILDSPENVVLLCQRKSG